MRTSSSACAATVALAASLLLGASPAYATPPGDNGTVKIHDAGTGEELRRNEPHVCTFYLDAFGFDGGQKVDWKIVGMPPTGTKGTEARSGSLTLDGEGHGRSSDLTLPDGHYKLVWTFDGEHGRAKHKVFWTDCGDESPAPGGGPGGQPSGKPDDKPSPRPSSEPSASAPAAPAPSPSPNGGGDDLAETGASVTGMSVAAVLLLGTGGVLALRRRARSRG
ncbi:LPXTG cell wall anchor domain-containing protein [Streptomyces sp. NPDC047108]|uniref:LPXTG cell wall anchor domain-containing protein n=1 Tax=Streptomyces sp. NPDC047108 TaxID=3155025 RepID=UPI0033C6ADEC